MKKETQKNLFLIVSGEWFEMIEADIKKTEYRELTNYWGKRLVKNFLTVGIVKFRKFDTVTFQKGYTKKHRVTLEHKGATIGTGLKEWGAIPGKKYFKIHLGKILQTTKIEQCKK